LPESDPEKGYSDNAALAEELARIQAGLSEEAALLLRNVLEIEKGNLHLQRPRVIEDIEKAIKRVVQ
jgi:hypothetical protein